MNSQFWANFVCFGLWIQISNCKSCASITCNPQRSDIPKQEMLDSLPMLAADRANASVAVNNAPYGVTFSPGHNSISLLIIKGKGTVGNGNSIYDELESKIGRNKIIQLQLIDLEITSSEILLLSCLFFRFGKEIRIFSFNQCEFKEPFIENGQLPFPVNLNCFSISHCKLDFRILNSILEQLPPTLTYLNVQENLLKENSKFLDPKIFAKFRQLKRVHFEGLQFPEGEREEISRVLVALPNLQMVAVCACNFICELFEIIRHNQVKWYFLDVSCNFDLDMVDFEALRNAPYLKHLNISGANCDSDRTHKIQNVIAETMLNLQHLVWSAGTFDVTKFIPLLQSCMDHKRNYMLFDFSSEYAYKIMIQNLFFIQFLDVTFFSWKEKFILKVLFPILSQNPDIFLLHLVDVNMEMSLNDQNVGQFFRFLRMFENLKYIEIKIPTLNITSMKNFVQIAEESLSFVSFKYVLISIGKFENQPIGINFLYLLMRIFKNTEVLTLEALPLQEVDPEMGTGSKGPALTGVEAAANWMSAFMLMMQESKIEFKALCTFFLYYPLKFEELRETLKWACYQPRIRHFGLSICDSLVKNVPFNKNIFKSLFIDIPVIHIFRLTISVQSNGKFLDSFLSAIFSHCDVQSLIIKFNVTAKCNLDQQLQLIPSLRELIVDGKYDQATFCSTLRYLKSSKCRLDKYRFEGVFSNEIIKITME